MAESKRPIEWSKGTVVMGSLTLGMWIVGSCLAIGEYRLGASGGRATGTVIEKKKQGRGVIYTIQYKHPARSVWATVQQTRFVLLELGDKVAILYDPNDPQSINFDNFWHRYLYPTLFFVFSVLPFWGFLLMLRPSDLHWLVGYVTKLKAKSKAQLLHRTDQFVLEFWEFDLSMGSSPRGGIANYFQSYGLPRWIAFKAAWDREAIPSLGLIVEKIDEIIANRDPVEALAEASPGIEQFCRSHWPAVLRELRDHVTAQDRESASAVEPRAAGRDGQ